MDTQLLPITIFCASIGLIACIILISFNKRNVHANRMLALALFGLSSIWIWDIFYMTGWIMDVPHLHRLQHPLHFVVAPASYLYVRALLKNETEFRSYDWIFFLPVLLHAIELTPLYLSGAENKRAILETMAVDPDLLAQLPEGMLPPYWHLYLKGGIGLIFMFFQWRLIISFLRTQHNQEVKKKRSLRIWLICFTGLLTALFAFVIISVAFRSSSLPAFYFSRLLVGLINVSILLFLLFKPDILYGLYPYAVPDSLTKRSHTEPEKTSILSAHQMTVYDRHICRFMDEEQPFLRTGFSLNEMAEELDIHRNYLSACINEKYGVNFNDFINQYRIEYIKNELDPIKWDTLTLEGIGEEGGFNSRSTFYNAFKKFNGITPAESRKQLKRTCAK